MKRTRFLSVVAVAALLAGSPQANAGLSQSKWFDPVVLGGLGVVGTLSIVAIHKANNNSNDVGGLSSSLKTLASQVAISSNTNNTLTVAPIVGKLTIDLGGGKSITVESGNGVVLDPSNNSLATDANGNVIRSLKSMLDNSNNPADKKALQDALTNTVKNFANQLATAPSGTTRTPEETKALVAKTAYMMSIVASVLPADTMSSLVQSTVTTLTKSSGLAGGVDTNTAIAALVDGAIQGGASSSSMVSAANTGAQANNKSFTASDLQSATADVNAIIKTPVSNVDVSLVSASH